MNTKLQTELLEYFKLAKLPFIERNKVSYGYDEFKDNFNILSTVFYSRQIACITGAPGTGKSSLSYYAVNELDPSEYRIVGIELSSPNKKAFYKTLALKLGLKPAFNSDDTKYQIIRFFNEENAQGKFNCVIIDEAQSLSMPMFDEIRSFYDEGANFSIILSGLPLLLNHLNLSINLPLKQRITFFLYCNGLTLSECKSYITHELDMAQCKHPIIDEKAFPLLHSLTSGAPRKINQFCYGSLLEAYKLKNSIITEEVLKIVDEKFAYGKSKL